MHASPELKTQRVIELNRESNLEDLVLIIYTLKMETQQSLSWVGFELDLGPWALPAVLSFLQPAEQTESALLFQQQENEFSQSKSYRAECSE